MASRAGAVPHYRVAILGAGLSGLCMAIQLKRRGVESFIVLEKAARVGGTWRENTYPGIACDVPSHLYSFSFELNPNWSRAFSPGHEIQQYCERCVSRYAIAPYIRFGANVVRAAWSDGRWHVATADGLELTADAVVSALGGLHIPNVPHFEGQDRFAGALFHSAEWRHDVDLDGKRVAVIGTGASAVQIVPEIAARVDRLTVFQRTPGWVVPRRDAMFSESAKARMRHYPGLARLLRWGIYLLLEGRGRFVRRGSAIGRVLERQALAHLEEAVADPALRARLTPDFPIGCKRILVSSDYFATLQRDNVELVDEPVQRLTPDGVATGAGRVLPCDVVVAATGFKPFDITSYVDITGRDGQRLTDAWERRVEAHRTVMAAGFPNFFILLGPNSGLGHSSVILMIEAQVRFVLKALSLLARRGAQSMEPLRTAENAFNAGLRRGLEGTVFSSGCGAWYTDERDQNFTLWPYSTVRYFLSMLAPKPDEYRFDGR